MLRTEVLGDAPYAQRHVSAVARAALLYPGVAARMASAVERLARELHAADFPKSALAGHSVAPHQQLRPMSISYNGATTYETVLSPAEPPTVLSS